MSENISRGQEQEERKGFSKSRRLFIIGGLSFTADQLANQGKVSKALWKAASSEPAKKLYGELGEAVKSIISGVGGSESASTRQYMIENGALVTDFEFNPPENLPFERIAWPHAPFNSEYPRVFDANAAWPNIRRWSGHAIRHSNVDYIGAGMTLAEMLRSQGYDETILLSQMWQESGGNPNAVAAGSDDTGLGQIVPSDGKGARHAWTKGRPTKQQLLDPDTNVEWMVRMLSDGFIRNGGTTKGAIQYYAGQGKDGYADMIIWLNKHIKGEM